MKSDITTERGEARLDRTRPELEPDLGGVMFFDTNLGRLYRRFCHDLVLGLLLLLLLYVQISDACFV